MSLRTNLHFESKSAVSWLTALWIFLMTVVFPYSMKDHYSQMGVRKFSFFLTVSLVCLIPAGVLAAGSWGKDCAAKVFLRMHKPESDAKTQTGVQAPSRSFSQQFRYCHAVLPCSDFRFVAI